jgi:hypothetical protein
MKLCPILRKFLPIGTYFAQFGDNDNERDCNMVPNSKGRRISLLLLL